jgi:hypothetical protein
MVARLSGSLLSISLKEPPLLFPSLSPSHLVIYFSLVLPTLSRRPTSPASYNNTQPGPMRLSLRFPTNSFKICLTLDRRAPTLSQSLILLSTLLLDLLRPPPASNLSFGNLALAVTVCHPPLDKPFHRWGAGKFSIPYRSANIIFRDGLLWC